MRQFAAEFAPISTGLKRNHICTEEIRSAVRGARFGGCIQEDLKIEKIGIKNNTFS